MDSEDKDITIDELELRRKQDEVLKRLATTTTEAASLGLSHLDLFDAMGVQVNSSDDPEVAQHFAHGMQVGERMMERVLAKKKGTFEDLIDELFEKHAPEVTVLDGQEQPPPTIQAVVTLVGGVTYQGAMRKSKHDGCYQILHPFQDARGKLAGFLELHFRASDAVAIGVPQAVEKPLVQPVSGIMRP